MTTNIRRYAARSPALRAGWPLAILNSMSDSKPPENQATDSSPVQVFTSDQSMHDVMRQQVAEMLANSDLTEEQKQQILVSMSCPCCGGGGVSLSIKLKD